MTEDKPYLWRHRYTYRYTDNDVDMLLLPSDPNDPFPDDGETTIIWWD